MTERKRTNDETMERLRSDPWLEAFVASRRRRPFAHQRAKDLAAVLAELGVTDAAAGVDAGPGPIDDEPEDEVVCGGLAQVACTQAAD